MHTANTVTPTIIGLGSELPPPPVGLARFLWACTRGARGYVLLFALLARMIRRAETA